MFVNRFIRSSRLFLRFAKSSSSWCLSKQYTRSECVKALRSKWCIGQYFGSFVSLVITVPMLVRMCYYLKLYHFWLTSVCVCVTMQPNSWLVRLWSASAFSTRNKNLNFKFMRSCRVNNLVVWLLPIDRYQLFALFSQECDYYLLGTWWNRSIVVMRIRSICCGCDFWTDSILESQITFWKPTNHSHFSFNVRLSSESKKNANRVWEWYHARCAWGMWIFNLFWTNEFYSTSCPNHYRKNIFNRQIVNENENRNGCAIFHWFDKQKKATCEQYRKQVDRR